MTEEKYQTLEKWFTEYVDTVDCATPEYRQNARIKVDHTLRVCREVEALAEHLQLSADDRILAQTCALLHDIGRFEQFRRYGTFVDQRSTNHALLGVEILEGEGILDRLEKRDREIVLTAIRHHNRVVLEDDIRGRARLFAQLLRDADKLDIWRVVTDYYSDRDAEKNPTLELDLPDTPAISDGVVSDIRNHVIVKVEHMRNLNDFKILQMGWVFDLNFAWSACEVLDRSYLAKIYAVLPQTPLAAEVYRVTAAEAERLANS